MYSVSLPCRLQCNVKIMLYHWTWVECNDRVATGRPTLSVARTRARDAIEHVSVT